MLELIQLYILRYHTNLKPIEKLIIFTLSSDYTHFIRKRTINYNITNAGHYLAEKYLSSAKTESTKIAFQNIINTNYKKNISSSEPGFRCVCITG